MLLQIYVNGTERTSLIHWENLQLQENLTDEVDVLTFSYSKFGSRTFIPHVLDEVTFYQDSVKVFGGTIIDIEETVSGVDQVNYYITVKDYSDLMDRLLVVEDYEDQPVINIICDILNRYVNHGSRIALASFESDEVWSAGTIDTDHFKIGTRGRKLTSTGSLVSMYRNFTVDLQPAGYTTSDFIDIDAFIDFPANLSVCTMKIGDATMTNYFSKNITSSLVLSGDNLVHALKSSFSSTGSPSWSTVQRIQLEVTAVTSTTVNVTFDNWQEVKASAFTRNNAYTATQVVRHAAFNYLPPSKAFKQLAELFQWEWYVDENKDINFFAKFTQLAPFNLSDTGANYIYRSLRVSHKADQLRNSIYVRGGEYLALSITDDLTHQVDGTNAIFKLGYKYANYSLTVSGNTTGVGLENIDQYHVNVNSSQVRTGFAVRNVGDVTGNTRQAQQILSTRIGKRFQVRLRVKKVGAPVDNITLQLFGDTANTPSAGSLSAVASLAGASVTTAFVEYTFTFATATTIADGDLYHLVIRRSGANDAANYYQLDSGELGSYDPISNTGDASTWSTATSKLYFIETVDYPVLYNFQEKVLKFEVAPLVSDTIIWNGQPYRTVIVQDKNNTSISIYGERQHVIEDKSIKTVAGAQQRAQQDILEWANAVLEASFQTLTPGIHAGQTIGLQSTIRGLDETYIAKSVTARCRSATSMVWDVNLVTTKTMGMIYWMQQLILRDNKNISVDEDEVLQRIESIYESVGVSDVITYEFCSPRFLSDDADTTANALILDGTTCDILN